MKRTESTTYDVCPSCGINIYCGPIRMQPEPGFVDISDCLNDDVPCPRCGFELRHDVEREWEDQCCTCKTWLGDDNWQSVEFQADKQRYRWWCEKCDNNPLFTLAAEYSLPIARILKIPLLMLFWCVFAAMEIRDWIRSVYWRLRYGDG